MTGEIPQPHGESDEYTPTFNLDGMSIEEAVALVSAVENSTPHPDLFDPEDEAHLNAARIEEALTEDLSRYPDVNFERSMALFEALSSSDNSRVRGRAGAAISGMLRAAAERTTIPRLSIDNQTKSAAHLCVGLLLDEDYGVVHETQDTLKSDIRFGKLPPAVAAFLFGVIAQELKMVHDGEVEPRYLAHQRRDDDPGDQPA